MVNYLWIDKITDKILERNKENYICSSGISVSGVLHVGKLRDIFISDLIYKSLKNHSNQAKLIYFVDDFDRFNKVPKNLSDSFQQFIGLPYYKVPDPCGNHKNFVDHFFKGFLKSLNLLQINPSLISQADRYNKGDYDLELETIFENKDEICEIVNKTRKNSKIKFDISRLFHIYCRKCNKEDILSKELFFNGDIGYKCKCGNRDIINIKEKGLVKLAWIVDWPSRWNKDEVDFEPIGPDHASPGGSYDIAKEIFLRIFNKKNPVVQQYGFVKLKNGKKMSSSGSSNISLENFLEIYEPDIVRKIFNSKLPKQFFGVGIGEEVFTLYDAFDKEYTERGLGKVPSFKELSILLQIHQMDNEKTWSPINKDFVNIEKLNERLRRVKNWVENYATNKHRFLLKDHIETSFYNENDKSIIQDFLIDIDSLKTEIEIENKIYHIAKAHSTSPKDVFPIFYKLLIGKTEGPRLARIIINCDKEKVRKLLSGVLK